jgi:hypothetical protein
MTRHPAFAFWGAEGELRGNVSACDATHVAPPL